MMSNWLRPLLMMFYAPARGMGEVRDRAPFAPAAVLALVAQSAYTLYVLWPYRFGIEALTRSSGAGGVLSVVWNTSTSVLFLVIVFVPVVIFIANLIERRGSFGLALQQEYASVAATVLYARAAASFAAIPLAAVLRASGVESLSFAESARMLDDLAQQSGRSAAELLAVKPLLLQESYALTLMLPLFALWLLVAVRESFRLSWMRATLATLASGLIMLPVGAVLSPLFNWVFASPFLLILLFFLMRGYIGELLRGQRARTSFKQNLEAATLNPADASAHYNLGLIHLQRKETDEARVRFERAVEIDADEVDAHYQLGRLAREQNRLSESIKHFGEVVARAPQHSLHEIWREIGATYLAAGQFADALDALERFSDERRSDPEGLYLMGSALAGLGRRREAAEKMQACIEAVKTAPAYKYRADKYWLNEAQRFLRTQA